MTEKEKKPSAAKRIFIITAALVLLAAAVVIYIIVDSGRVHYARNFGFSDLVSSVDADGDGADDYADMVSGARAYIATAPLYESAYYAGGYPTDGKGVCTDVVWQAFAAAGYTLKDLVDADIAAAPEAYFQDGESADPNIDFRRVRNLLVYFRRHATPLTTSTFNPRDWMPGDIVIYDGHIAICSDKRNMLGIPYIIHHGNAEAGAVEADQLNYTAVVAHFRLPG